MEQTLRRLQAPGRVRMRLRQSPRGPSHKPGGSAVTAGVLISVEGNPKFNVLFIVFLNALLCNLKRVYQVTL